MNNLALEPFNQFDLDEVVLAAKSQKRTLIGLGVGLSTDYGNAQRLYVQLGYVPDGEGLHYNNMVAKYGDKVTVDDDANEQYFKGMRSCRNLAVKIGDQYVGLLSLNFPYDNNSNIYWMAVLRDYQAKGVGRRLIEEACQLARKLNATTMTVETLSPDASDNNYLKTYQFYQSVGFKPLMNLKPEGYEWDMVKYLGAEK